MDAVTLYSTWPDADAAKGAARMLIEQRLAACANVMPGATSIYRWDGAVAEEAEVVMFAKTSAARAEAACAALAAAHPYTLPCIAALRIEGVGSHGAFLAWIGAETC